VVGDALLADAAAVRGWGVPAALGGPFAAVDTAGAAAFVATCDRLRAACGSRFEVPQVLRAMAAEGRRFHAA
jgi:3-hydroxyacyl-CoA dehydrogenase/enoyl-CoA hydratase/3-hydroxybutyryl-CoA epimerase